MRSSTHSKGKRKATNDLETAGKSIKRKIKQFQIMCLEPSSPTLTAAIDWELSKLPGTKQTDIVTKYLRSQLIPNFENDNLSCDERRRMQSLAFKQWADQQFYVIILDSHKFKQGLSWVPVFSFYTVSVKLITPPIDEPYYGFSQVTRINKISSDIPTDGEKDLATFLETDLFKKYWSGLCNF